MSHGSMSHKKEIFFVTFILSINISLKDSGCIMCERVCSLFNSLQHGGEETFENTFVSFNEHIVETC